MSSHVQALARRVGNLEAVVSEIQLNNNTGTDMETVKLQEQADQKQGLKHIDWIRHFFDHDQSLKATKKAQFAYKLK